MMRYQPILRISLQAFIKNTFKIFYLGTVMTALRAKVWFYGECLVSTMIYMLFLVVDFYITILLYENTWKSVPVQEKDTKVSVCKRSAEKTKMRMLKYVYNVKWSHKGDGRLINLQEQDLLNMVFVCAPQVCKIRSRFLMYILISRINNEGMVVGICVCDFGWRSTLYMLFIMRTAHLASMHLILVPLTTKNLRRTFSLRDLNKSDFLRRCCITQYTWGRVASDRYTEKLIYRIERKCSCVACSSPNSLLTNFEQSKKRKGQAITMKRLALNCFKNFIIAYNRGTISYKFITDHKYNSNDMNVKGIQTEYWKCKFMKNTKNNINMYKNVKYYICLFEQLAKRGEKFEYSNCNHKRIIGMEKSKFKHLLRYWQRCCKDY